MQHTLCLTLPERDRGYTRGAVKRDVLYNYFRFREIGLSISKKNGCVTRITDDLISDYVKSGIVSEDAAENYRKAAICQLSPVENYDPISVESFYASIHQIRKSMLSADALRNGQIARGQNPAPFPLAIDQKAKKEERIHKCNALIFVITQAELYSQMESDLLLAQREGKEIWIIHGDPGDELLSKEVLTALQQDPVPAQYLRYSASGIESNSALQERIDTGDACLLFYGEEGLIACRSLAVDAIVTAYPVGYHALAVTNLFGRKAGCVVYIPAGFDITRHVKLTQKTRLTYNHLARLCHDQGDGIYKLSVPQLYQRFPGYFTNIYDNEAPTLPISLDLKVSDETVFSEFDRQLDLKLSQYLGSFPNCTFQSVYYNQELVRQPICYDSTQTQSGILVQTVRIRQAKGAEVIRCEGGATPRQMFRKQSRNGTAIVSNFLFFMTPKLGLLYNDLRADRPMEQADAASGHLDYMLVHRNGKRVETFPLFRKTCIAKKRNGDFMIFNFRMGGGRITLGSYDFQWTASEVDSDADAPVKLYTPYYTVSDADADRDSYRKFVGHGRVNVIILREKVVCVRKGDVILPSVGVVLSLTEEAASSLTGSLKELDNGYYTASGLSVDVELDPPEQVSHEEWNQVEWAYGGALTLIRDSIGLCDNDDTDRWFTQEGWMSPLSRQTQESSLHTLVKHPRTAIGLTQNGDLVILVYSGRTWRSSGADYREMISIARQLYPDIRYLMNCDGGGSAMLGMVCDGAFLELSCPSTSSGSCMGMVRPINTLFCIPLDSETKT